MFVGRGTWLGENGADRACAKITSADLRKVIANMLWREGWWNCRQVFLSAIDEGGPNVIGALERGFGVLDEKPTYPQSNLPNIKS